MNGSSSNKYMFCRFWFSMSSRCPCRPADHRSWKKCRLILLPLHFIFYFFCVCVSSSSPTVVLLGKTKSSVFSMPQLHHVDGLVQSEVRKQLEGKGNCNKECISLTGQSGTTWGAVRDSILHQKFVLYC